MPFSTIQVYGQFKLAQEKIHDHEDHQMYIIKATPSRQDTVIVLMSAEGESAGLEGEPNL